MPSQCVSHTLTVDESTMNHQSQYLQRSWYCPDSCCGLHGSGREERERLRERARHDIRRRLPFAIDEHRSHYQAPHTRNGQSPARRFRYHFLTEATCSSTICKSTRKLQLHTLISCTCIRKSRTCVHCSDRHDSFRSLSDRSSLPRALKTGRSRKSLRYRHRVRRTQASVPSRCASRSPQYCYAAG